MYVRNPEEGECQNLLPRVSNYTYLGIDFAYNWAWGVHIKKVRDNCMKKDNYLHVHSVIITGI